jgi:hypothetical protein
MIKLLILLLIIPFFSHAQFFSGEITYELKIIPKSDTVELNKIVDSKLGTTMYYTIGPKRYKTAYFKNGKYNYSYTNEGETKRMYDDYSDKVYITFRDSGREDAEYTGSIIFKDSTSTILGDTCFLVTSDSKFGISKRYYSDDIKVNYADFEGHSVGNWYNSLKEVDGAITLKSITEYDTHFEVQEAVKIEKRKVKSREFALPAKPVAASLLALDTQVDIKQPTQDQIDCYQRKVVAASNPKGEKFTSYVTFLIQKNGELLFIEPYKEDEDGFYKIAVDIIQNCGFQFIPGKINNEPVNSQMYFPVEFLK